jgi:hypothetical protein
MRDGLAGNIAVLRHRLDAIDRNTPNLPDVLHEIENLIQMCDRLVECSKPSPGTLQNYSRLRRRYRNFLASQRGLDREIAACHMQMEALTRQSKVKEIEHGVHEIMAVSGYISHVVESQRNPIDNIAQLLNSQLEQSDLTNGQLEQIRKRRARRYGIMRSLLFFVFVLIVLIVVVKSVF